MKISGFLMVAMLGASTFGVGAEAATQSAMAGHGWPNYIDSCLSSSFAQVVNNCSSGGARLLIVPMQVSASGNYQASARAAGSGAYNSTSCQAMAIGSNNSGWSFSSLRSSNVSTTPVNIVLGGINVPPQGTAHFECRLGEWVADFNGGGSGGRLINVELI